MAGEDFLNKVYRDLNLSDEVQHTARGTKDKNEAVKRYMNRLERVHERASKKSYDLDSIKAIYRRKYCIKKENYTGINYDKVVKKQGESLDRWIDYLVSSEANFPMWAKYWAFQGMLKIGSYDRNTGIYQKRSKKTLARFIEVDPEVITKCIEHIISYVDDNKIDDEDLKKLIESGNFGKLYVSMLSRKKKNLVYKSKLDDGIWVKFNYETEEEANRKKELGIEPEYVRLFNALQGYNTRWCTAGSKIEAKEQICGNGSSYEGGDFYLYCTKDKDEQYKVPRIAIRMDLDDIGEIRGIADGQNLEDGLELVVEKKIRKLPNVSSSDVKEYMKKIYDTKRLTSLYNKFKNNREFSLEEIKFIYELDSDIDTFGWTKDKRIREIVEKRDNFSDFGVLTTLDDKIKFIKKQPLIIKYLDKTYDGYKELAISAVRSALLDNVLQYVDKTVSGYSDIVLESVKVKPWTISTISANDKMYNEISIAAVNYNPKIIQFINPNVSDYIKIAKAAVREDGNVLRYVRVIKNGYKEIAIEAMRQNGLALMYVNKNVDGYLDIAMEAVKQNGLALQYVDKSIKEYKDLVNMAIEFSKKEDNNYHTRKGK